MNFVLFMADFNHKHIAIIGSGAWGTALAIAFSSIGHNILLLSRNQTLIHSINHHHYYPDFQLSLPPSLKAGLIEPNALTSKTFNQESFYVALSVVPVQVTTKVLRNLVLPIDLPLVLCSKGLDLENHQLLSHSVNAILPNPVLVLSGPSFATEVAARKPAALVLAAETRHYEIAKQIAQNLTSSSLSIACSGDIIGTQLGGALKNIYAIAAGLIMGLDQGENLRAAVITQALAEMKQIGIALGAKAETFDEAAGIGDLVLCCTSPQSRNYRLGVKLAKTNSQTASAEFSQLTEGLYSLKVLYELAQKHALVLPLLHDLYHIVYCHAEANNEANNKVSLWAKTKSS